MCSKVDYGLLQRKPTSLSQCVYSMSHVSTVSSDISRVLSQHEKYRKCYQITSKLASLASESTMGEFNQCYEVLLKLMSCWESGKMAYIMDACEGQYSSFHCCNQGLM